MVRNKKILVTGGAGFIGSNLCETLLKTDNRVYCLDNFATGYFQNIKSLVKDSNFTLIEGDIRNPNDCKKAVAKVDFVIHQAALGSVPRSIENPLATNEVNISGFINMLEASKNAGIKRFVYASSSSVYGDSEALPKEESTIGKPLSPYAVTKYVNEVYAAVFHKNYGLDTIGLRYFNVFGKNQDPNGAYAAVIPKFVKQLIQHKSPVINGDGSFSRDFTFIDNVVNINLLALTTSNPNAVNQVYNVACGEQTTIAQLANYLKEFLSQKDPKIEQVEIKNGPERAGDIPHSLANIEKSQNLLGYKPLFSAKEGLQKAVQWYWEHL